MKCVAISKTMQFALRIIDVIEPVGCIKICDLKNALDLPINGCFSFGEFDYESYLCVIEHSDRYRCNLYHLGHPNITSLILAFHDIFVPANGKPISCRSEIKVNQQCIRK